MKDVMTMLQGLKRPRLLIRAARIGSDQYQPNLHLPRILGYGNKAKGAQALLQLIEMERDLDERRRTEDATYNVSRHVDILCAMMGEARLMRVARTPHLVPV